MRDWTRWFLVAILVISAFSLVVVYRFNYIAEVHLAHALPLAIVTGLSAIALAIYSRG